MAPSMVLEAAGYCLPEVIHEAALSAAKTTFHSHRAAHLDPGVCDVGKKGRPVHKRIGRKLQHHSTCASAGSTTAHRHGCITLTPHMPPCPHECRCKPHSPP